MMLKKLTLLCAISLAFAGAAFAGGDGSCNSAKTAAAKAGSCEEGASMASQGWLGIEMEEVEGRIVVTAVIAGSPAAKAGFQKEDVLLAFNDLAFAKEHKAKLKAMMKVGAKLTATVLRGDAKQKLTATLAPRPAENAEAVAKAGS